MVPVQKPKIGTLFSGYFLHFGMGFFVSVFVSGVKEDEIGFFILF